MTVFNHEPKSKRQDNAANEEDKLTCALTQFYFFHVNLIKSIVLLIVFETDKLFY